MLKTKLKLPLNSGTYNFKVKFKRPIKQRQAIFVVRPLGDADGDSGAHCSLIWSSAAGGYFLYSPAINEPKVLISKSFSLDLPVPEVELEVLPWAGANLEGVVENISLISKPTESDPAFTTFLGEDL